MGLGRAFLGDLLELKRSGALNEFTSVVEIGAQQLADSLLDADDHLEELHSLFMVPRVDIGRPVGQANFTRRAPSAHTFWTSLGFSHAAIDYDGHRGSIPLDLNSDRVPDELRGSFDLVVNAGTSEHIVNQDNCFRVMHDLVRKGGVIYHEVPACLFGHGLINYSPKFFLQVLRQNDYDVLFIKTRASPGSIPKYVQAMNRKWGGGGRLSFDVTDITITAAFKKLHQRDFCTPLDLPRRLMAKHYLRRLRTLKHLLPMR